MSYFCGLLRKYELYNNRNSDFNNNKNPDKCNCSLMNGIDFLVNIKPFLINKIKVTNIKCDFELAIKGQNYMKLIYLDNEFQLFAINYK